MYVLYACMYRCMYVCIIHVWVYWVDGNKFMYNTCMYVCMYMYICMYVWIRIEYFNVKRSLITYKLYTLYVCIQALDILPLLPRMYICMYVCMRYARPYPAPGTILRKSQDSSAASIGPAFASGSNNNKKKK